MRSVNLILKEEVELARWKEPLAAVLPIVWLEYSEGLARREGLPEGVPNELGIEDGYPHVMMSERPTTVREYEPDELETLRQVVGSEPKQFFAVDYTDDGLLRRVLAALLQHEGEGKIVVEDDQGNLAFLEDFLAAPSE